jgi:hypothetical protein
VASADSLSGACTCRDDVDFEYSGFNGLSFSHDSVESALLQINDKLNMTQIVRRGGTLHIDFH